MITKPAQQRVLKKKLWTEENKQTYQTNQDATGRSKGQLLKARRLKTQWTTKFKEMQGIAHPF